MNASTIVFQNKSQKAFRSDIFLVDPLSDVFLFMDIYVFPLHRNHCAQIKILSFPENLHKKVLICPKLLNVPNCLIQPEKLIKILAYLYGSSFEFYRNKQILQILQIIEVLKIQNLAEDIIRDLFQNFSQYQPFFLLQVSRKYKLQELQMYYWKVLQTQGYQSIKTSTYNLMRLSSDLFEDVIAKYSSYSNNGFAQNRESSDTYVEKLINQYCIFNEIGNQLFSSINFLSSNINEQCSEFLSLAQKKTLCFPVSSTRLSPIFLSSEIESQPLVIVFAHKLSEKTVSSSSSAKLLQQKISHQHSSEKQGISTICSSSQLSVYSIICGFKKPFATNDVKSPINNKKQTKQSQKNAYINKKKQKKHLVMGQIAKLKKKIQQRMLQKYEKMPVLIQKDFKQYSNFL